MPHQSKKLQRKRRPEWLVVRAFALAIVVGTILLALPWATPERGGPGVVDALFTSTSATCVTGLVVRDTGADFTRFGQVVILCLIQAGGLGIMTLGTLFLVLVGRRLSIQGEFVLMDALGHERARGLKPLLGLTIGYTVLFEACGAGILAHRFITSYGYGKGRAIYHGIFHSVSAFCNAGFGLYSDSLTQFREDPVIVLTVAILIILGGLGFLVLYNLSSFHFWRRNRIARGRLSLHTRIVLSATAVLLLAGTLALGALEWNNTLASLSIPNRLMCAFFQSATPRTAGFNVVEMSRLRPDSFFFTILLMFIGGSPASAAGGIKTTTVIVLILTMITMVRGKEETECFGRSISPRVVREALAIFLLSGFCVAVFFGVLLVVENVHLPGTGFSKSDALLFETVSAFGTVGLSTGITPALSALGKLILTLCMFIGRLGPLSLALFIGAHEVTQTVQYPEEEVVVG